MAQNSNQVSDTVFLFLLEYNNIFTYSHLIVYFPFFIHQNIKLLQYLRIIPKTSFER